MMVIKKGRFAEIIAYIYLLLHNYKIISRNYRVSDKRGLFGEIDIIARKKNLIVFIEVKYRSSRDENILEYILSNKQIKRIKNTARIYQSSKLDGMIDYQLRIDLIYIGPSYFSIRHIKNILGR